MDYGTYTEYFIFIGKIEQLVQQRANENIKTKVGYT
jgi:hypothetical protein